MSLSNHNFTLDLMFNLLKRSISSLGGLDGQSMALGGWPDVSDQDD